MVSAPIANEHDWPRAHLVVDDFFASAELSGIFREIASLDRRMKPGLVRDIGHDGQSVFFEHERRKNRAVWIRDPSRTLRVFRERLWSDPLLDLLHHAREPLFQIIPHCWAPHLQVSSYMTGDHYDFHEDEGAGVNLTAIVFLALDPKKVRGGDFVLAYDGEETTIPFQNNRLLVFPSRTLHRVTPVTVASEDPRHARISLQCWLAHASERPPVKPRRRAPAVEADRPTFLLAEPPIVAAAQAMSRAAPSDQSPDDLYWGAMYLSRILSSNLRCLLAEQDGLAVGPIRIRRGDDLEVHARGRLGDVALRVGFVLRGPPVEPARALCLFVETGRGSARKTSSRALPPGATEPRARAILRALLARARSAS